MLNKVLCVGLGLQSRVVMFPSSSDDVYGGRHAGLWILFTVPVCTSKLAPQAKPPSFLQPRGRAQTDGS